ncbi:hypothetical protein C8J57DRAFT_1557278 [Mycena rebaudengoi]|nr:hypothetical protein C8J57DRAFT_1557278 [Mycena rebaudengoi]
MAGNSIQMGMEGILDLSYNWQKDLQKVVATFQPSRNLGGQCTEDIEEWPRIAQAAIQGDIGEDEAEQDEHSEETEVLYTRKEIILSAGSVRTPTILLHSGVGDAHDLAALDIPSVLDLSSVGENSSEHPVFGVGWLVSSTQTAASVRLNATLFNEAYTQWNNSRTGPFVELATTHIGWFRINAHSAIFKTHPDPSAGPGALHIELAAGMSGNLQGGWHWPGGSVTINSSNPFDPLLIDLGLLTSEYDILAAREGVKMARSFFRAPAWSDYILGPVQNMEKVSDEVRDAYLHSTTSSGFHLVGTAAMSARNARYGAVDPDLLVCED